MLKASAGPSSLLVSGALILFALIASSS